MDEMNDKVATVIRRETERSKSAAMVLGDAATYRLNPPLESTRYDSEADRDVTARYEYVWVSQAGPLGEWETYIFPADKNGRTDWGELDGSRRGYITPDDLMRELGYRVVES